MNAASVAVRAMTPRDLPEVVRLEHTLFDEDSWSEEMLRSELAGQPRTRHYIVAEEPDGTIVGYAGLAAVAGQGDVHTIGVSAGAQGRGVGAALLRDLLDEAVRRRCEVVFLEVRSDNERARGLYKRFGFADIGVRKGYYQPSGADAVVMSLRLRPPGPLGFGTP